MFDVETIAVAESGVTQGLERREKELAAFYKGAKQVLESVSQKEGPTEDTRRQFATQLNARFGGDLDAIEQEIKLLAMRRDRLRLLGDWSKEDPGLMQTIDGVIVNRLKASRRRQRWITFVLVLASLIIGWLLSSTMPATVLTHLVGH